MKHLAHICGLTLAMLVACAGPAAAAPISSTVTGPPQPRAIAVGQHGITIAWGAVPGAASFEVARDGARVGTVPASVTRLAIRGLRPATASTYVITARTASGALRGRSQPAVIATRAPTTCTRVVAANGNDSAAGTADAPWRTVAHLTALWQPGWVGCIRGTIAEDVNIGRGGTASQPAVLRSEPGARARWVGRIVIQRGADHVVLTELTLDGRALTGLGREDLPSPTINGDGALILRNDISNARTRICLVVGSIRGYGRAHDTAIVGNRIHDCGERDASDHGNNHHHGIYVEGADRTRIAANVIFQNADRGIQLFPDADGSLVVGNVLDGNGEGLIFSGGDGYNSENNRVLGNVVTNSRTRYDIEYYWEVPGSPGAGNVARGNCVGGGHDGGLDLPASGYTPVDNVLGPPRYRSRSGGDFRAAPGSRCAAWLVSAQLPLTPLR